MEMLQRHVDKHSSDYNVDKMIKERNVSVDQLNLDEDFTTRNMLSTLAPKQNDIKICDVINESVGNFPIRTKVNPTGVSRKQSTPNFPKNEHFLSPDTPDTHRVRIRG